MVVPIDKEKLTGLPMSGGTLEVRFESPEDVAAQHRDYLANMGLFVSSDVAARPFSEFSLIMALPNGIRCDPLPARLVQVVPFGDHQGMMLQLLKLPDEVKSAIAAYLENPDAAPEPTAAEEEPEEPPATGDDVSEPDEDDETAEKKERHVPIEFKLSKDRLTLKDQIAALRPDERSRLAARADRITRSVLIRDPMPGVVVFLLKNPQISRQEVVEISKLNTLNHQAATIICANKTWIQSEEIRYNLVINPKISMPIAMRLIPSLSMKHLRELAKNHNIKEQIKRTALRLVLERGP